MTKKFAMSDILLHTSMTFEYVLEDTKLIQLDVIIANETMLYGSKGNNDGNDGAGQSRR